MIDTDALTCTSCGAAKTSTGLLLGDQYNPATDDTDMAHAEWECDECAPTAYPWEPGDGVPDCLRCGECPDSFPDLYGWKRYGPGEWTDDVATQPGPVWLCDSCYGWMHDHD